MRKLSLVRDLQPDASGWGFFLCARKELRTGRNGPYLALLLQDASGQMPAKIFQDAERFGSEFDVGEFVKVQGRGNSFNGRLELLVENIRRVDPQRDSEQGFREEDCIASAPRDLDEMWRELEHLVRDRVRDPSVRTLLQNVLEHHHARLRVWPAAQVVHHAYRGGLLEHVLRLAEVTSALARSYGASEDLVIAGAILHDIGKLQELDYEVVPQYSVEGSLVGHITLGAMMLRSEAAAIPDFPDPLRVQLEHLIVSHHGARELGSPVEPKTVEAFILSAADDLDAKIHQVRRHLAEDETEGAFTGFHSRLKRVLYKKGGAGS